MAGVLFEVTRGGVWFEGYWWWVCPTGQPTASQKFALWQVYNVGTGVLISSATVSSTTLIPGQWNYVPLPTPIPLAIGACYNACTALSGSFPATTNQFGAGNPYSAGITNGPLAAFSDQSGSLPAPFSMSQGVYSVAGSDPTALMPANGDKSDNLWMDLQVSDVAPDGSSYRLWPNYPSITGEISNDTNQQTMGTEFQLSQPCTLNNIWFYSPPGVSVLPSRCAIWDVPTQQLVAATDKSSPAWSGATGSGWVACAYEGVTLPQGNYKVTVYSDGGHTYYQENTHYFSSPQASVEDVASSLGPTAWWQLADGVGSSMAADSSGNSFQGSVHGGVTFGQAGPLEGGATAAFDGSTGYLSTPLNFSSSWSQLSIAGWVQVTGGNQTAGIAGSNNAAAGGGAALSVSNNAGTLAVHASLTTSAGIESVSFVNSAGVAWADGKWHHIALTWDGATVTCYLDAQEIGNSAVGGTLTAGSSAVTLGVVDGSYLTGNMAQLLISKSALAAVEVKALYHPAASVSGPGWNGITAGPLSSPNILKAAAVIGNSTNLPMTGNSTYSTAYAGFVYPDLYDIDDDGEVRWVDVEVTPVTSNPSQTVVNSGAFLAFFP